MVKVKERGGVGENKGVAFPEDLGIVRRVESSCIKSTGCPGGCEYGRRIG